MSGLERLVRGLKRHFFFRYMAKWGYQTNRGLKEICNPFIKGLKERNLFWSVNVTPC
jgi:hypothetical protein